MVARWICAYTYYWRYIRDKDSTPKLCLFFNIDLRRAETEIRYVLYCTIQLTNDEKAKGNRTSLYFCVFSRASFFIPLKGQCHEIFDFSFFFMKQSPPSP